ncbi:MAG: hypothetical protein GY778_05405 [bacterium]|nr:hypothetical protein [bacterium]
MDGHTLTDVAWPGDGKLRLRNVDGTWTVAERAPSDWKGPHRYGPFKNVFRNNVVFVYGTVGSDAENAWAYAKARYDAETFWYRGNGAIELRPDVEYDHDAYRGRNVVLYGNADTNAAWAPLLKTSPVQLGRDVVRIGDRTWTGGDLAMLLVRPVPGDERALVGVVGGTGLVGMRATVALPYFVSGVGYPDCTILRADALRRGLEGVVTAGSFGERWEIEAGAFPERTAGESEPDDETP